MMKMKQSKQIAIWSAVAAMVLGVAVVAATWGSVGFGIRALDDQQYEMRNHWISEPFQNIRMEDVWDVRIEKSSTGKASVFCADAKDIVHSVRVENGTLMIQREDHRPWYEHIGITFWPSDSVILSLPDEQYHELFVKTVSGNIDLMDGKFQKINLSSTSGDIRISSLEKPFSSGNLAIATTSGDVECWDMELDSLTIGTISGDVKYFQGKVNGPMQITTISGDVEFPWSDAQSIEVSTVSGDVEGTLMSGKMFSLRSVSGTMHAPDSEEGNGRCEIATTSGNITISVAPKPTEE